MKICTLAAYTQEVSSLELILQFFVSYLHTNISTSITVYWLHGSINRKYHVGINIELVHKFSGNYLCAIFGFPDWLHGKFKEVVFLKHNFIKVYTL